MKVPLEPKILRESLVIFLAAVFLGSAYNSFSPLGVRMEGAATASPAAGFQTNEAPAVAGPQSLAEAPDPALRNETITAVIVAGGSVGAPSEAPHKLPVAMPWAEVKPLLARGELVLVDGRDSLAYEAGHIPGAVSLPLKMLTEKIGAFTAKYAKTTPLVIYCASIQCPISHAEAGVLAEQFGYADVREMPGGYAEWMVSESKGAAVAGARP